VGSAGLSGRQGLKSLSRRLLVVEELCPHPLAAPLVMASLLWGGGALMQQPDPGNQVNDSMHPSTRLPLTPYPSNGENSFLVWVCNQSFLPVTEVPALRPGLGWWHA
jgi:hypothetical protein